MERFHGKETPGPKDNDESFFIGSGDFGESQWRALVERFDSIMKGWKKAILEADEAALAAPIKKASDTDWHSALADMIIHTAYHLGQIVTLRKLQGSWDPKQGVN